MKMKKTCIIKNIALDDVDEKKHVLKKHLKMQMKIKTCIMKKTCHLMMMQMKKHVKHV